MDDEELDAIKARANAATPGPWYTVDPPWGDGTWICEGSNDPHGRLFICSVEDLADVNESTAEFWDHEHDEGARQQADADFIAQARRDVPRLVAEVERLRSTVARMMALASTLDAESVPVRLDLPPASRRLAEERQIQTARIAERLHAALSGDVTGPATR